MEGRCACGAVTVTARPSAPEVSACHCAMCRRWTGGAVWCLEAEADAVTAEGPVRVWRSSEFAERAFCGACGSHLWIRDDASGYDLSPGLFDDAAGFPLVREIYVDRAFASARFAGGHARATAAEYEAGHRFIQGDAQ